MDNKQIDERKRIIKEKRIRKVEFIRKVLNIFLVCVLSLIPIMTAEVHGRFFDKQEVQQVQSPVVQKQVEKKDEADVVEEIPKEEEEEQEEEEVIAQSDQIDEHSKAAAALDEVNLYREATEESEVIAIVNYGEIVSIKEDSDGWLKVQHGDLNGYVKKNEIARFNDTKKQVALTFDDGPSSKNTPIVLDALEKYNCRATFFLVGTNINDSTGELVKKEQELGCQIGNHTYSHANLKKMEDSKDIKKQITKANKNIKKYIGKGADFVRTPYGATSEKVLKAIGAPNIYWSVDTEDWKYKDSERLIKYIKKNAKNGSIILMHDIHESTANAVASICKSLIEKDFELVTVSELAAIHGTRLENENTYFGFESSEEKSDE